MKLPKRAGDSPIKVALEANKKYAWCSCGLSEKQPFCDGKHKGTEMGPHIFSIEKDTVSYLCTCKSSNKHPYCDGTHNK